MSLEEVASVNQNDLKDLNDRMKLIVEADAQQYHNEYSLKRYLKAFKTTDSAFQAILKTNRWRLEYGVEHLANLAELHKHANKARVLKHRDCVGRPVIYIPAKNHNSSDRDINELTKFIVKCLEDGCKKCFEEVIDNLCIVFDLVEFNTSCLDMELIKNMIWLLSKHYPERLGVCLIINSPGIFSTVWPLIRQLIDDNTAKKVVFVKGQTDLCKYLIPDILPTDM